MARISTHVLDIALVGRNVGQPPRSAADALVGLLFPTAGSFFDPAVRGFSRALPIPLGRDSAESKPD